ncbi:hypothetical protein SCD_n01851 [Sulfuricella denitrificans skB26]|uniref:Uncharacterized protein n=1 Tax=Sulfuricella denitrificans (strain DSM 22764 / NBRC 105220 / skB26) TaxID=1163617 RepID=S6B520_SULDS|nr:hypothetical protein [Sulfuricella denitrificans]BAN35662.1 hypothetical protein SCD_n01851 [Sulfuricella denitrificans skB26]
MRVKSEFEGEAGVIGQAGQRRKQGGRTSQVAIAAIVALRLVCGGGVMVAIMASMMILHPGLHCWRRSVIVSAERHPGRGKTLQWKPQQQKAEYEIAQAVPHNFLDIDFLVRL